MATCQAVRCACAGVVCTVTVAATLLRTVMDGYYGTAAGECLCSKPPYPPGPNLHVTGLGR